jgi:hypothetical protein
VGFAPLKLHPRFNHDDDDDDAIVAVFDWQRRAAALWTRMMIMM